jgi:hypothetical protein
MGVGNARLIAAAPALLDVLKQIVSPEVLGFIRRRDQLPAPLFHQINAIIAKVEGQ